MLEIRHLSKKYRLKEALKDVSLVIRPYEIHGVLGRNGCGKSTLFKSIMGLIDVKEGDLLYQGKPLDFKQRTNFGFMPEQRSLLLDLTVEAHLAYIGSLRRMGKDECARRIESLSTEFGIEPLLKKNIHQLSKGQQQKIQLMMALLNDPKILILDEPLNGLDYESVQFFLRHLKVYASKGNAVLISSHQMEFMDELCTHLLVLNQGTTVQQGRLELLQESYGVVLKVNGNCRWQALAPLATKVVDQDRWVQFEFQDMRHAQKALLQCGQLQGLSKLRLQPISIGDLLKESS